MKTYWDLTREQRAEVALDPVVLAASTIARDAALAILAAPATLAATAAAAAALDATYYAYTSARAEATARLFGGE